jgi:hypothetical protein
MGSHYLRKADPDWCVVRLFGAGGAWSLIKECTVCGRNPECDLVLPSIAVCRKHFLIHRRLGGCYLEDLDSRCGTFLDRGPGYNNGSLRPDCEIHPGGWQITGLTPLRAGDVFGHPACYLRLERLPPVSAADWSGCSNSQGMLLAIRGTPAADPERLRRFLESCRELLETDDQEPIVFHRLRGHPDPWSAAAGLARFVVAKATTRLQHKLTGNERPRRQCVEEVWRACDDAEFRICRLLRGVFGESPVEALDRLLALGTRSPAEPGAAAGRPRD